ncbi:hypothetical protein FRB97_005515 [Tulasnella sp. 331]|nr:hypothetical protein FRB97_005515 [Tulasnella sp. 331]
MDMQVAAGLVREIRVWAKLRHPNVLPFIGFHLSQELDQALLISPHATYGSVLGYIKSNKPTEMKRLQLDNVLVNDVGDAMLCDFGLTKVLGAEPSGLTTDDGNFKGAVRWTSPEVLEGEDKSLSSDVWSWGCLLLEILKDSVPYPNTRVDLHIFRMIWEGYLPENLGKLKYPLGLDELLRQCWDHDADQRPNASRCHLLLQSSMKFALGRRITCKLNHPTPTPWLESSWSAQAQALATMPQPLHEDDPADILIAKLEDLAERLEKHGMLEEASYARSSALNLQDDMSVGRSRQASLTIQSLSREETQLQAYRAYKYLYVLHLQCQDHRLVDSNQVKDWKTSPPPAKGESRTRGPHQEGEKDSILGTTSSADACTACEVFFARPSSPVIPPSNCVSDPSSVALSAVPQPRKRGPRFLGYTFRRQFNYDSKEVIVSRDAVKKMIEWAIRQRRCGRATVKEICETIMLCHPSCTWAPLSPDMQRLRHYVRDLLCERLEFRPLESPGYYWECVEPSIPVEQLKADSGFPNVDFDILSRGLEAWDSSVARPRRSQAQGSLPKFQFGESRLFGWAAAP